MSDERHKQPLYINFPDKTGQRVRLSKQHQLYSKSFTYSSTCMGPWQDCNDWLMRNETKTSPCSPAVCNGECHLEQNVEHINYFYDEFKILNKIKLKKNCFSDWKQSSISVKNSCENRHLSVLILMDCNRKDGFGTSINPIESSWE